MPIPIQVSTESTQTGPTGPHADASSFGGTIAQGMENLGTGIEHSARGAVRLIKLSESKKAWAKQMDDTRWAGEAYENEKKNLAEFMADPANHTAEDFAKKVEAYTNERIGVYTSDSAPSPQALQMFKTNFGEYSNAKYDSALDLSYRNKVKNTITSVGTQTSDAITTYRNSKNVPNSDGMSDLVDSIAHIGSNIEQNFRKFSPDTADKLHADLITQSVLATMNDKPEAARTILDSSDKIDEQTRRTLSREIDQSLNTRNLVERDSFNNIRDDVITQSSLGKNRSKIPIGQYEQFFPADKAQVEKNNDDQKIDNFVKANDILDVIKSQSAEHQLKTLSSLRDGMNSKDDVDVYKFVHQQTQQNLQLQEKNPVGWLQKNNPQVSRLMKTVADSSQENLQANVKSLYDATLKYQGAPPPGTLEEEKKQYLNRPINDQHLLDVSFAEQTASDLNQSNPKEFIKKMGDVLAKFPDEQHQFIAFNDLVTMPSKGTSLKQEYQLAWQNKDAWWLDMYLGAVANNKSISIPDEKDKELTKIIDSNPTWLQFQNSMVGEDFSRASQISGFRNGIQMFAQGLLAQGNATKQAAQQSVEKLISSTMGFTKVNGKPLMVLREQGPGIQHRTNEEVGDIGRRLQLALQFVDPREVDQKPFTALGAYGPDENHLPRLQSLRDSITARAFFQTGGDGQSVSLYYSDDLHGIFQVRDKHGQPFNINFKDLPKFETTPADAFGFIPGNEKGFQREAKTYDIVSKPGDAGIFGFAHRSQTNWPAHVDWLHAATNGQQSTHK